MKQWINNLGGRQVSQSICGMRHSKKTTTYETKQKEKENKWNGDLQSVRGISKMS